MLGQGTYGSGKELYPGGPIVTPIDQSPDWTLGDSILLGIESVPMIGTIVSALDGSYATSKAAQKLVDMSGLPNPTIDDIKNAVSGVGQSVMSMAQIAVILAAVWLGLQVVKTFKE
jgi:hypothetical protein